VTPTRRVRTVGTLASVAAVIVGFRLGYGQVAWWGLPLLAGAVAGCEIAVVHLAFGRQRWTFSLTEAALAAAFVLDPGGWVIVAAALGIVVALAVRRQPRLKFEYNVAQFCAGTALAAATSHLVGGGVPGGIAGMGVFWLVNNLLIAHAVAVMSNQRLLRLLWESAPLSAVHSSGTSSLGVLGAWLLLHAPFGVAGLIVPLLLLWLSYDEQTSRAAEARLFAELARLQEQAAGRSTDSSALVVLTAAARLFGGADVEMVLVGADGPIRFTGDEHGIARRRVDPEAFDSPWVLQALGAGGVRTGHVEGRPYCSAVLGDSGSPLAVLIARRPAGAAGFGRREIMLAQVLVRQAESWLSLAELTASRAEALEKAEAAEGAARALGDIGAHTAPSLAVLRETTSRLARLAATEPDQVTDIVDELHAVERAVASLLGAIAIAADPELARLTGTAADDGPLDLRTPEHWTTTGILAEANLSL